MVQACRHGDGQRVRLLHEEAVVNIFRTSDDPRECAAVLADQHVTKMVLETAQIISTVFHIRGLTFPGQYRATHRNHPCVVWAAESRAALTWTMNHGHELVNEFCHRNGKDHRSAAVLDAALWSPGWLSLHDALPNAGRPAPICVAEDLRHLPLHEAYRQHLARKYAAWARTKRPGPARWTNAQRPEWA